MVSNGGISIQLQNFPAANRDARVKLTNSATGQVIERKPFLDGSLVVRDIEPGQWEVQVTHPNVTLPIFERPIKILPQNLPTFVPIPIRPSDFLDTPIRDIPDADLGPVQQAADSARVRAGGVAGKAPGEVIRSADWNALALAVADLAASVLQLASLVAPRGHDHPEIAEKIDEVQGNVRRFTESFGKSLLELRRDIESGALKKRTEHVFNLAGLDPVIRDGLLQKVDDLHLSLQATPVEFSGKTAQVGALIAAQVARSAQELGAGGEDFLKKPEVQELLNITTAFSTAGSAVTAERELETYRRTTALLGTSKIGGL